MAEWASFWRCWAVSAKRDVCVGFESSPLQPRRCTVVCPQVGPRSRRSPFGSLPLGSLESRLIVAMREIVEAL